MKIFVTGASGYIGSKLSLALARQGHEVHALIRNMPSAKWISHPNIKIFLGDVLDISSVRRAMAGCEQVYHVAGKAGAWATHNSIFYLVNVEGTRNILEVAKSCNVMKIVYTSSCGVLGPTLQTPLNEKDARRKDFSIHYDRSKKMAEDLVHEYTAQGMDIVIVSPTKVFGPGHISHSLMMNRLIERFLLKKLIFIPAPGTYQVGFAAVDDIVQGHQLAMEKGRAGETYILGGTNLSHFEFFDRLRKLSSGRGRIIMLPRFLIQAWAWMQVIGHFMFGTPVSVTPAVVDHLFSHYIYTSDKAIRELGYHITPVNDVLRQTIAFLEMDHEKIRPDGNA